MTVVIKRIYDEPKDSDGYRVLVDRLWPRGMTKERARIDAWLKDIAPSPELRSWFDHKPERMDAFRVRYGLELDTNPSVQQIETITRSHRAVTLLYAARDPEINHARILLEYMKRRVKDEPR